MPEQRHTPGPWRLGEPLRNRTAIGIVCDWQDGDERGESTIAEVLDGEPGIMEADARLIAAAPDMLEACQLALDTIERWNAAELDRGEVQFTPAWDKLQAAIAHACGQEGEEEK